MFALKDVQIKFQMPLSDIDGNKYLFTEKQITIYSFEFLGSGFSCRQDEV